MSTGNLPPNATGTTLARGDRALTPPDGVSPRRWRWLAPLLVVATVAVLGFGGYVVDIPLEDLTAKPVTVGGRVRVVPLSGWRVVHRPENTRTASVVLARGGGNLQVVTGRFSGDSKELLADFLREVVEPQTSRLVVSHAVQQVRLNSGLTGVRAGYLGSTGNVASIEGQVTAVVSRSGTGVVFNAWTPEGLFPYEAADVDRMVATTVVRS